VHRLHQRASHVIVHFLAFGGTGVRGVFSQHDDCAWRTPLGKGGVPCKADIPRRVILGMGAASTGRGSCVRRTTTAPREATVSLIREYTPTPGVDRAGPQQPHGPLGCELHVVSVNEWRTSQNCSRCWHAHALGEMDYKCKACRQQELQGGDSRQPQQLHVKVVRDARGRRVVCALVLHRDLNAARNMCAKLIYMLVPRWMIDPRQLAQLEVCLVPPSQRQQQAAA
jgi:hypothetical protein